MTTDQRKPFAPTRPGRYELRNGEVASVYVLSGVLWRGLIEETPTEWLITGYHDGPGRYDIIGFAPDDAAWCLARARELAEAHGFAIVPKVKLVPHTANRCSVCNEVQFETSSGVTCQNGHGGAPPKDNDPLQAETQPTLKVRLPIITDELREEFSGGMKLMDETGWTQGAVDFACLLQGTQTFVLSAPQQPTGPSEEEERAAFEAFLAEVGKEYLSHIPLLFKVWRGSRARLAKEADRNG